MEKNFPNGFASWQETHFEVVRRIASHTDNETGIIHFIMTMGGTGGLYEFAEALTDEFENAHKNKEWDGEFFDQLDAFFSAHNI